MNFARRLAAAADRRPDRIAVERVASTGLLSTTYAELTDGAAGAAAWLETQQLVPGDRVAILADNDAPWIAAYLGILSVGGVVVPLDTAYRAGQVGAVLQNSDARVIYTTARYVETVRDAVSTLAAAGPTVALLPSFGDQPSQAPAVPAPPRGSPSSSLSIVDRDDRDAAIILYTSGTTADPKGVVLTHGNLAAECDGALSIIDCAEDDVVLGVLPLFHSLAQMANLLVPLAVGARVVFLETISSTSLLQALQERGVTIFACVPQFFYLIHQRVFGEVGGAGLATRSVFRTLLAANGWLRDRAGWNAGRRWFARVHRALGPRTRLLITGGSRFDPAIGRDLYALGFTILNGYGLTETSGAATVQRPDDRYTTSVGQPLPHVEIRIAAPEIPGDGHADSPADGEILIRGPIVMREYFNRPEATKEALKDGWLQTGDLGHVDALGRLYITGRKKEIIVLSSGKNLYPEEIEAQYRQSPFIKELCVLGRARPDQPAAERLHAIVVPNEEAMRARQVVNVRELIRFELESQSVHLPPHKRILTYDVQLEPLPRTTTGKLKRQEIARRIRANDMAADRHDAESDAAETDDERTWSAAAGRSEALRLIADRVRRRRVRPGDNLELDLSLDSMERVELLTTLEQRYNAHVAPETRATIFTVRQLIEAAEAARGQRSTSGATAADATGGEWAAVLAIEPDDRLGADLASNGVLRTICFFAFIRLFRAAAVLTTGFRAEDAHHLPASGPFLICPNHQSFLDGLFLTAAFPFRTLQQMFFVGAAEHFQTPLARAVARLVGIVPVDPDANLVQAMRAGAAGLRRGRVLIIFPEGERSIDGTPKRFKKGAAILSSELGAPIVPVALDGLFELWPRGRAFNWSALLPWRRTGVRVRFGAPITVAAGAYAQGTDVLAAAVGRMFEEMSQAGGRR